MIVLDRIYAEINDKLKKLDFQKLWPGFSPLKYALYNDSECYFNGEYIPKTDDFCANTAIHFNGEVIAIWQLKEETNIDILVSKIVHEMFHGFQELQDWDCFANEKQALVNYRYDEINLSLKYRENTFLSELAISDNTEKLIQLLESRKYRSANFPYEYDYECRIEEIEGTAAYVEWNVLKQINPVQAEAMLQKMVKNLSEPDHYFPIRISSYDTGALMYEVMLRNKIYRFDSPDKPQGLKLKDPIISQSRSEPDLSPDPEFRKAITRYYEETSEQIQKTLVKNEIVLTGPAQLLSVNIYDARYYKGYITTNFFLLFEKDEEIKELDGDFILKMKDPDTIDTVYLWSK